MSDRRPTTHAWPNAVAGLHADASRHAAGPGGRRRRGWQPSRPLALLLLAMIFGLALLAPLPALPSAAQADVVSRVEQRLPGWEVVRTLASWEGAWTVVARCGGREVGFQMVPGHGLPPDDAWIHPDDPYSWSRLATVSDDRRYLVWYRVGGRAPQLSCQTELARDGAERRGGRTGRFVD